MKEIGKTLKDKREHMNLSLSDVHKAIRVQEKYLAAIEEGDLDAFKAEVYYKSFLRSYSKYLAFDPEEFVELFNAQRREIEYASKSEDPSFSEDCKNIFCTKKIFIVVAAIVAAALLIVFVCLYKCAPKIVPPVEVDGFKQVEVSAKQNLEIEAKETVWIRVDIDGKTAYEGTLSKGGKKMWEADKSVTLKVGYAPGVKVSFNGKLVDVVSGAVQDVNTVVLKKK
ncbi:MAG: DUF4115 domain-containing protein [Endomicrobium sp.]|jgi:cytoskeletal protein RodZ|nr:DUF4115 domain-containing protein [Endomicrobium sp.]